MYFESQPISELLGLTHLIDLDNLAAFSGHYHGGVCPDVNGADRHVGGTRADTLLPKIEDVVLLLEHAGVGPGSHLAVLATRVETILVAVEEGDTLWMGVLDELSDFIVLPSDEVARGGASEADFFPEGEFYNLEGLDFFHLVPQAGSSFQEGTLHLPEMDVSRSDRYKL